MSTPTKPYVSDDQIRQMEAGKFMSERPYEMNYEQGAKDVRDLYEARKPTKADQIREALEHALSDMEFAAQAPAYWQRACDRMKQALSLLADLDGGGEVVNTHAIIDAAVECFDLGPEDQDAVLRFGMRLEGIDSPWISVKDRLPEDIRTVLVRMPNGTPKLAWYMDTSQGQSMWFDPSTDCRMYPVKWMEIPE